MLGVNDLNGESFMGMGSGGGRESGSGHPAPHGYGSRRETEGDSTVNRQAGTIRLVEAVYAFSWGGSEILAYRIVRALNHSGQYLCKMYAVQETGPMLKMLEAEGIGCRAFEKTQRFDLALVMRLAKQMRADRVQIVHTHHLSQLMYAGLAARLAGARVVHTEHEYYLTRTRRAQRLLRILSSLADRVTAIADPVTDFLRDQVGIPVDKLVTIVNGVDIGSFASAEPINRSELGWAHDDVVVASVARLAVEKGHHALIKAFGRLHGRNSKARLLLVGDGSLRAELQQRVEEMGLSDSVRFVGERKDIPRWLATCDVFALASVREGLPMVILEAMAAGKPVVSTNVGCVHSVVQHGETGLLVAPGDVEQLTAGLDRLVGDAEERRRIGRRGHEFVQAQYTFTRMRDLYRAEFEKAIGRA
jgi:glycosyltransferase involved in cell wall biosynthesis